MSKHLKLTTGIISLLLASGCATIKEGFYQEVTVNSNAPGAYCTVSQDGRGLVDAVVVPGKVLVRRDRFAALHVSCERGGYGEATMTVPSASPGDTSPSKTFDGMASALVTAGGSLFFDQNSGAGTWYPDKVFVWMEKN